MSPKILSGSDTLSSRSSANANSTASTESTPRSSASSAVGVTASGASPRRWMRRVMTRWEATVSSICVSSCLRHCVSKSGVEPLEDEAGVDAAETKGVRQGDADFAVACLVRHVVEVALGVRRGVIDGRWQKAVLQREYRGDRLHGPGRTEKVSGHGICRAHRQPLGVSLEDVFDGTRLIQVVERRGCAVRVDVVHLLRGHPGIGEGQRYGLPGTVG